MCGSRKCFRRNVVVYFFCIWSLLKSEGILEPRDLDRALGRKLCIEGMAYFEISCSVVRRELSNYFDGQISNELRDSIECHVLRCRECRALFDGTRNLLKLLSTGEVFPLPLGFSDKLFSKLNNRTLQ